MKDTFFLLIGLAFTLGSIFIFFSRSQVEEVGWTTIRIATTTISVEIRDTPSEQAQGLSGRASLEEGKGMLFVFDTPDMYGFWMKDMNFPIDIIWIDESRQVVGLQENALPDSYPEIFYPTKAIKYVLEVPAGFAKKSGIDTGSLLYFE